MKILIVGENKYQIYEKAFQNAFISLNNECKIFGWSKYIDNNSLLTKIQNKFVFGPIVSKINYDLEKHVNNYKPDLIFLHRANFIKAKTIAKIKNLHTNTKIICYHNDDPFSENTPKYLNRHFNDTLKYCDWIFAYRIKNLKDYRKIGFNNISLLRSYYIKENNFYIETTKKDINVLFIGHFENDGRDEKIKYLLENNIDVKLFGTGWKKSKHYDYFKSIFGEIKPIYGEEYNLTLNRAKMALVFLSKLNNDTYTRRCFEIPITKSIMVSEYTDDLNSMFEENKEALYFRNKEELLNNIQKIINNDELYDSISNVGYQKIQQTGHEVINRAKTIISSIYEKN